MHHLHSFSACWEEGSVPQDMRDANVVTLYESPVEYSGGALCPCCAQQTTDIAYACLVVLSTQNHNASSEQEDPPSTFSLSQLHEKCREQRRPLNFADLKKAVDLVSGKEPFILHDEIEYPQK